ncbi:hypothetical protein [Spartinivicinus poritis]|uniref:Uncharacterized protein n=1 Tax=Spartinivicinus poritis TaxID=2994640 RepID=A0ABT5UFP3_9GAMM|nr:hypothetical protein [Spartinivicinus sp. A2-2]MDE1465205.1 hypothetical protein [Spartinivicinus sp. A2-2]
MNFVLKQLLGDYAVISASQGTDVRGRAEYYWTIRANDQAIFMVNAISIDSKIMKIKFYKGMFGFYFGDILEYED